MGAHHFIDNATEDVAEALNRLGGAHIPTKAKRFAEREAQSLIVSSLLLIDLSLRRLLFSLAYRKPKDP
jgi:hypothetical protein